MAKFYGNIGYAKQVESPPESGIWIEQITTRKYSGDFMRNSVNNQTSDSVIDDIRVNNQISIVVDPFAYQNFHSMRYIEFMGTRWKITSVEVQYPRLILTMGGVYNGK